VLGHVRAAGGAQSARRYAGFLRGILTIAPPFHRSGPRSFNYVHVSLDMLKPGQDLAKNLMGKEYPPVPSRQGYAAQAGRLRSACGTFLVRIWHVQRTRSHGSHASFVKGRGEVTLRMRDVRGPRAVWVFTVLGAERILTLFVTL
jgi:hypothetical protein